MLGTPSDAKFAGILESARDILAEARLKPTVVAEDGIETVVKRVADAISAHNPHM